MDVIIFRTHLYVNFAINLTRWHAVHRLSLNYATHAVYSTHNAQLIFVRPIVRHTSVFCAFADTVVWTAMVSSSVSYMRIEVSHYIQNFPNDTDFRQICDAKYLCFYRAELWKLFRAIETHARGREHAQESDLRDLRPKLSRMINRCAYCNIFFFIISTLPRIIRFVVSIVVCSRNK